MRGTIATPKKTQSKLLTAASVYGRNKHSLYPHYRKLYGDAINTAGRTAAVTDFTKLMMQIYSM